MERADVNVALIYDASGSISAADFAQQLEAMQNTIDLVRTQFTGAQNDVTIQLIRFATNAHTSGSFDLFAPALDNISALGIASQTGGSTNYTAPLRLANVFFESADPTSADDNFVLFVSDGQPTAGGDFATEASELQGRAAVTAVGFGSSVAIGPLNQIDNTGGAQIVPSPESLGDVFAASPLFDAVLFDFDLTLSIDGGLPVVLADDSTDLTNNGAGNYSLDLASVTGLSNAQGSPNTFTTRAVFDTDGDIATDADRVTLTTTNIVQGAVLDFMF